MIRLIAIAFALALASSAQAMPLAPLQADEMVITVRDGCGAGRHRVDGVCVRNRAARVVHRKARRELRVEHRKERRELRRKVR